MITVYTAGVWDMLHAGHLNMLLRARALGDRLFVGVCSDRLAATHKGRPPLFGEGDRLNVIRQLRCVDAALLYDDPDQSSRLAALDILAFAVGEEYGNQGVPEHQATLDYCVEKGIAVFRLPRTPGISTTILREKLCRK